RTRRLRFVAWVTPFDARLASSRWSGATGRAFHPQGSYERFQSACLHLLLLSRALLGAITSTGASVGMWDAATAVSSPVSADKPKRKRRRCQGTRLINTGSRAAVGVATHKRGFRPLAAVPLPKADFPGCPNRPRAPLSSGAPAAHCLRPSSPSTV